MAESVEYTWTESGMEFIEGRGWVPYTRAAEPNPSANGSLVVRDGVSEVTPDMWASIERRLRARAWSGYRYRCCE